MIDYKTGGPSSFTPRDLEKGKKLQLPLYALAARDALHLGTPVDGFYWHIEHAKPSEFTLASGAEAAMARAAEYAWEAVDGVRHGRFTPQPRRTAALTTVRRPASAGAIARRITSEVG